MAIRLSGMVSGLDTDSLVQELVSSYSKKKDKYTKAQTKMEWTIDAWKTTNSKVYSFYSSTLSSMRFSSGYNLKTASVSDSKVATVKASSTAVTSSQSLSVKQLATSGYLTGGKITTADGNKPSADTKLSDMGITEGSIMVNDTNISLDGDMTLSSLTAKMKGAGVDANFDAASGRFFVSSKTSGADGEFTVTAGDTNGIQALKSLGLFSAKDIDGNDTAEMARYREMADVDVDELTASRYDKEKYTLESYKSYISKNLKTAESNLKSSQDKLDKYSADDYDWKKDFKTEEDFEKAKESLNEKISSYQQDVDKYSDILATDDSLKAAMDSANQDIFDKVKNQTANEKAAAQAVLASDDLSNSADSARITGKDAIIKLNGATFTGNTNSFSINGLNISVNNVTETVNEDGSVTDNPVTINTSVDTQGIYDKIVDMFKGYNELISYIDGMYNAESADGYEPLTDEEQEAMTDKQVEKWEEKVKNALLRKDSTLGDLSSAMKNALAQTSVNYNGKTYTLASFGIGTGSYFSTSLKDKGVYHIDGNKEDSLTSSNTDKLMSAIASDPEGTMEFFQKMSQNLYTTLSNKMAASSSSSAFTIYNDKEMSSQYCDYKDKVKTWEDKVSDYEEYYYKKFSKMESALSKLQSQTSSLSGLLGQ